MKNCCLLSLLVFLSLFPYSCKDTETTDEYIPQISLLTPHENDAFNLDEVDKVSFSWATEGITAFKLLLSLTEDLASPQISIAGYYTKDLTADELDVQLTALGLGKGEEAKVYWSIQPAGSLIKAETQVRSIRITRKSEPPPPPPTPPTIALSSPADNAQFDANTITYPLQFVWIADPEVSEYVLKVSSNGDFSDPTHFESLYEGTGYSHSLDEPALDALLAGFGVAYEGQIMLYWTVTSKDNSVSVVTQTRTFSVVRKADPDVLTLLFPGANSRLCINEVNYPYEFRWSTLASETQGYILKFSADNFSTAITFDAGNNGSYTLLRTTAETLFSDLGVANPAQIQWTVEPKSNPTLQVEKRPLNFYKWEISYGSTLNQAGKDTYTNLIDGDMGTIVIINGNGWLTLDAYIEIDLLYTRQVNTIYVFINEPGRGLIKLLDEGRNDVAASATEWWGSESERTLSANQTGRYVRVFARETYNTVSEKKGFYEAVVTFND